MAYTEQIHTTVIIPYVFRPENSWYFKIKFVQEDGTTPFDMAKYNLYLSVHKSEENLRTPFNLVENGTNEPNLIVCQRRERTGQMVNGVLLDIEEDGIYLKSSTQEFWIQYTKPLNEGFKKGKYIANLWAVTEFGVNWDLVSFAVEVTNDDRSTSVGFTQLAEVLTLPVQKIDTGLIILPLKLIPR